MAAAASLAFLLALVAWFAMVAPANAILATWGDARLPTDADAVRWQWESGHVVRAAFKLGGIAMLALAVARRDGEAYDRERSG